MKKFILTSIVTFVFFVLGTLGTRLSVENQLGTYQWFIGVLLQQFLIVPMIYGIQNIFNLKD